MKLFYKSNKLVWEKNDDVNLLRWFILFPFYLIRVQYQDHEHEGMLISWKAWRAVARFFKIIGRAFKISS